MSKLITILPNGSKRYVTEIMPDDIKLSIYPTDAIDGDQLSKAESVGANIMFFGEFAVESTVNVVKNVDTRINGRNEIELMIMFTDDTFQAVSVKQPCTPRQMYEALVLLANNVTREIDE